MPDDILHRPDWHLPTGVQAFFTTRYGGTSTGPFAAFNLGLHVGDREADVVANRQLLKQALQQANGGREISIQWLQQVHGARVYELDEGLPATPPQADGLYTRQTGLACCVLTADCLPVLFCSADGQEIAVAHAGWRGLQAGIIESTLARFSAARKQIKVWLGPAIGPCHFEVGAEVKAAFMQSALITEKQDTEDCFRAAAADNKWLADLYALARLRLRHAGIADIAGEPFCTVCHADALYSHRHSQPTGRFATLIFKAAEEVDAA